MFCGLSWLHIERYESPKIQRLALFDDTNFFVREQTIKMSESFPAMNKSKLFFTPLKCKNFKQFIRDKNQAD